MNCLEYSKFEEADFDDFFSLISNEDVMKQIIGRPHTLEEAQEIFKNMLENNRLHPQCGTYKVTGKEDNTFIGFVKLELEEATSNEAEIGYMFMPQHWGKGYGNKAAEYVIHLAENIKQLTKLTANIDPENVASRKVLTNHGFESERFYEWQGLPAEWLTRSI